jgi:AAA+ ATPase superfamily predicted ATPase
VVAKLLQPAPTKYFPLGGPVPAEDLVGRERYIAAAMERLLDGQNLLVAGPRRIGKTSVILEALRRLRRKGAYTAYVDCLGATSLRGIGEKLVDALLENQTRVARSFEHAKALARGAKLTVRVRYEYLEVALELAREGNEQRFFEGALDLPEKIATRWSRRVVVVFDEFQACGRLGTRVYDLMRTHFQTHRSVAYVFLGSEAGLLETLFTKKGEPLYRFAVAHDLADPTGHRFGIDPEDWLVYIRKKLSARGIKIGEADVDQLLDLTGGHPQDTMQVCAELYYFMRDAGVRTVTAQLLSLAYEQALRELERAFALVWAELGRQKYLQAVAKRIAYRETLFAAAGPLPRIEVLRAVGFMRARGLVLRLGRGKYEFVEPMFAEYVRRLDAPAVAV